MKTKTISTLVIVLTVLLTGIMPLSAIEKSDRGFFINSSLSMLDLYTSDFNLLGGGIGYYLNFRWSIQGSGYYRKYKEKEIGRFATSTAAVFLDLRYNMVRKKLSHYLFISEGVVVINRAWIHPMPFNQPYREKEVDLYFFIGGGAGASIKLWKFISIFIETRLYVGLYKERVLSCFGFSPVVAGISIKL
jgi:hypothetical protein